VQILAGQDIQVVWVPADNTAIEGYEGAVKGAKDARLPLITDECSSLSRGGLACLGVGLHSAGLAAGKLAGRASGQRTENVPPWCYATVLENHARIASGKPGKNRTS